ncbi:MAG: hypothetical protein ABEJ46_02770, partial [Gemmatimonadota bacterium]
MTGAAQVELAGVLRAPVERLREAVGGEPAADRRSRGERWLVFETDGVSLRVRCESPDDGRGGGPERVASWTATFRDPPGTLRAAAEALGMWPELAPDRDAAEAGPMIRRPLPAGDGETVHSVTAAVRDGGILQMTAFDEPP